MGGSWLASCLWNVLSFVFLCPSFWFWRRCRLRRRTGLCRGHRISVSWTCSAQWLVAVCDVQLFGLAWMSWILESDFCKFGFCLTCDLHFAELFLAFSWHVGRSFWHIRSEIQSSARTVRGQMLAVFGWQTLVLLGRIHKLKLTGCGQWWKNCHMYWSTSFSCMRNFRAPSLIVRILLSACPLRHGEPTLVGKNFVPGGCRNSKNLFDKVHCRVKEIWGFLTVWWSFVRLLWLMFVFSDLALGRFGCNLWTGLLPIGWHGCLFSLVACLALDWLPKLYVASRCSLFFGVLDLFLLSRWIGRSGSCWPVFWVFLWACFAGHGNVVECRLQFVILGSVDRTLWNVSRWSLCQATMLAIRVWDWTE